MLTPGITACAGSRAPGGVGLPTSGSLLFSGLSVRQADHGDPSRAPFYFSAGLDGGEQDRCWRSDPGEEFVGGTEDASPCNNHGRVWQEGAPPSCVAVACAKPAPHILCAAPGQRSEGNAGK